MLLLYGGGRRAVFVLVLVRFWIGAGVGASLPRERRTVKAVSKAGSWGGVSAMGKLMFDKTTLCVGEACSS